jgi:hypothetical protein
VSNLKVIDNGIAVLDEHNPGWWQEGIIDTDVLDISDPDKCVVGQLYGGDYKRGLLALFGSPYADVQAVKHGFTSFYWQRYTQEWREAIWTLRKTRQPVSFVAKRPPVEVMNPRLNGWELDGDHDGTCTCGGTCARCQAVAA